MAYIRPEIGLCLTTVPWARLGKHGPIPSIRQTAKQETLGFFLLLANNHYAICFNMVTWGKFYIYHYLYVYYLKIKDVSIIRDYKKDEKHIKRKK